MAWDIFNELRSNWHQLSDSVELHGEEGMWTVCTHEADSRMFLCAANDQHGSIKLLYLKIDTTAIDMETANEVRKYLGLKASDAITDYDIFMAKCGDDKFVGSAPAFIIG